MARLESDKVQKHLEEVLRSPHFVDAERQAEVLTALVDAAMKQERTGGRDLTERIYGRRDDASFQAFRQTVRNLRRTLKVYYASLSNPSETRFELSDRGYDLKMLSPPPREAISDTSKGKRLGIKVWRLAGFVVVASLAVGAYFALRPPGLPARVELREGREVLVDDNGRELREWSKTIAANVPVDQLLASHEGTELPILLQRIVRSGIIPPSADRHHPLVAVAKMANDEPGHGSLLLMDGRDGSVLDSVPLPYFPGLARPPTILHFDDEGPTSAHFHLGRFRIEDFDDDGNPDGVVVSAMIGSGHDPNYPTQILAFEVTSDQRWRLRRNYWIAGSSEPYLVQDLDDDGLAEIVVGGTNNDFECASVVILKLDEPDGRTPIGRRRKVFKEIEDLDENGLVLLFPKTLLSDAPAYRTPRTYVRSVEAAPSPGGLSVTVADIAPWPPQAGDIEGQIRFDFQPPPESIRVRMLTSDTYYTEFMRWFASRPAEDKWSIAADITLTGYAEYLAGRIELWDGSESSPRWEILTTDQLAEVLFNRQEQATPN